MLWPMEYLPSGLLPLFYALAMEHKEFEVEARALAPHVESVAAELERLAAGHGDR